MDDLNALKELTAQVLTSNYIELECVESKIENKKSDIIV